MKKLLLLFTLSIFTMAAMAQEEGSEANKSLSKSLERKTDAKTEGWTKQGILNVGLNQGSLQNWAAGGERASMALNGVFNGFATRIKGNTMWENTLDMFYGLNYVTSNNFEPRKIDDRIDFSSRYGVQPKSWTNKKVLKHTYLTGLARVQTQFSKGYNYDDANFKTTNNGDGISNFLSPMYVTLALGANYRPNNNFSVFFSPAAARLIFASDVHTQGQFGAFGIDQGETFAFQFGAYLTANYNTKLTKNIDYRTRLDLYSNYLKDPQNVDILWDNLLAMKIGKYIGASLGVTMVYDHDVRGQLVEDTDNNGINDAVGALGWTQLKQVLNVGLQYKF